MVTLIEVLSQPAVVAAIVTIIGGILMKVAEKWLTKNVERRTDRKDYRDEIKELHERIDVLEAEIDQWRIRYYQEQETVAGLRVALINAGITPPPVSQ